MWTLNFISVSVIFSMKKLKQGSLSEWLPTKKPSARREMRSEWEEEMGMKLGRYSLPSDLSLLLGKKSFMDITECSDTTDVPELVALNRVIPQRSLSILSAETKEICNENKTEISLNSSSTSSTFPCDTTMSLSEKQLKVLKAVASKKSVFFTGAAGTGKSYVLKILQDMFEGSEILSKVAFTAPTGVAACNIRGLTIHSWAGIGGSNNFNDLERLCGQVYRSREAKRRWELTEILVIDEISMLSAGMFDALSTIGCKIRNNFSEPFGGIQLVICGDFFQLPPVGLGNSVKFCFLANQWSKVFSAEKDNMIVLDKVFRQKDPTFLNLLHELRRGMVSSQSERFLLNKVRESKEAATRREGVTVERERGAMRGRRIE